MLGNPPYSPTLTCPVENIEWLRIVQADSYNFGSENLRQAASKQKKYHDRGLIPRTGNWN